jgi:response regulator RpfG family c-di-GMP phosphodiesterase
MAERILVVDDDLICEFLIAALGSANYLCVKAHDDREALAMLASDNEIGIILCSPTVGPDPTRLLESAKTKYPDVPVVIMNGSPDLSVALDFMRAGACDYLLKPFRKDALMAAVRRALEQRRLRLEGRATGQQAAYDSALEILGHAIDLHGSGTPGRSKRVTAFSIAIARATGLDSDLIRVIARGAFFLDLGKIAIPNAILRKPGRFVKDEVVMVRQYCRHGYQILSAIPFMKEAAEIVYCHQERHDGTGYPRGLSGEQIPLGARIAAVANALEAITSDQPYRFARSIGAAREEIHSCSGTQFDPEVVRTFLSMPENIWENLRREIANQS